LIKVNSKLDVFLTWYTFGLRVYNRVLHLFKGYSRLDNLWCFS